MRLGPGQMGVAALTRVGGPGCTEEWGSVGLPAALLPTPLHLSALSGFSKPPEGFLGSQKGFFWHILKIRLIND